MQVSGQLHAPAAVSTANSGEEFNEPQSWSEHWESNLDRRDRNPVTKF